MDQTVISDSWADYDNDTKSFSKSRRREQSVKIKGISSPSWELVQYKCVTLYMSGPTQRFIFVSNLAKISNSTQAEKGEIFNEYQDCTHVRV